MSVPNLIPYKSLYISDYICSCYAFVFIFDFLKLISKHILQFHASLLYNGQLGNTGNDTDIYKTDSSISNVAINQIACSFMLCTLCTYSSHFIHISI